MANLTAEQLLSGSVPKSTTGSESSASSGSYQPYVPEKPTPANAAITRLNQEIHEKPKQSGLMSWLSGGYGALQKTGDFLKETVAGSTGRAVGGLITAGIGGATELAGRAAENEDLRQTGERITEEGEKGMNPIDIAFSAIELWPGGGEAAKTLRALPGGEKLAVGLEKTLQYVPDKLKEKAIKQYMSIFKPTSKEAKMLTEEVAPEMLKRETIISSVEGLESKAGDEVGVVGKKIGTFFEKMPDNLWVTIEPVFSKLDDLKSKYMVETAGATEKVFNEKAVSAIEKLKKKIALIGKISEEGEREASMKSVRKVRQILDEHYDATKGIDDITTYNKKAERAAADSIRRIFSEASPDLDKLNKEYSFWRDVKDLAEITANKEIGKDDVGLLLKGLTGVSSGISGTLGMYAGYKVGGASGALVGGMIGASAGANLKKLITSPAWKSVSAIQKNKLADAIASGNVDAFINIVAKLTAAERKAAKTNQKEKEE